jgi:hypothetical protein
MDIAPNDEPLVWTAVATRWRHVRRSTAGLIAAALFGWGSWVLAQHVPAMFSALVSLPPIIRAEAPKTTAIVGNHAATVQPVAAKALPPRGPVIRNVAE